MDTALVKAARLGDQNRVCLTDLGITLRGPEHVIHDLHIRSVPWLRGRHPPVKLNPGANG